MIADNSNSKHESIDFAQNILYCLYPSYLPATISNGSANHSLLFLQQIIDSWNYSIRAGRPETYTLIDQIINGVNKAP